MRKSKPLRPNRLYVEQTLRCFMLPVEKQAAPATKAKKKKELIKSDVAQQVEAASRPFGGFCLIFDTETFEFDHGQKVRFGAYQLRGVPRDYRASLLETSKSLGEYRRRLDRPVDWGLFYDPASDVSAVRTLKSFQVAAWSLSMDPITGQCFPPLNLMTAQEFIKNVLYGCAKDYGEDLLIIGHNLAFDIGALSTNASPSQDEFWFGGFTLKLCDDEVPKADGSLADDKLKCIDHPPMHVKPIGAKKRLFGWRTEGLREGAKTKTVEITSHFLDTSQFARALLGPIDTSLENLTSGKVFDTTTKKSKFTGHDGPIKAEYLAYCLNDVQATFEVWDKLRERYREHGLSKGPWEIYSEASLGKGYYQEFGVPQIHEPTQKLPAEIIGLHMQAYYGGRSEVRIRRRDLRSRPYGLQEPISVCECAHGFAGAASCRTDRDRTR